VGRRFFWELACRFQASFARPQAPKKTAQKQGTVGVFSVQRVIRRKIASLQQVDSQVVFVH
ncbi:hypothetical protein, partial [Runella sp.]|uniref:hypothetical protein n=1 Tax=Runella sp. TaxID=1960881 RepID=UPI002612BBC3